MGIASDQALELLKATVRDLQRRIEALEAREAQRLIPQTDRTLRLKRG
jgi:hypothetical protein